MEDLDGLTLGGYYTGDYLKQTRMIENTKSLGILYDLVIARTKKPSDYDVKAIQRKAPDTSLVYQVVERGTQRQVSEISNKTAFGEVLTARFEPLAGWAFTYNINPSLVEPITLNGGSVTKEGSSAKISTGTDPAGEARVHTIRASRYVPGIGGLCRFTAVFSEPKENCKQVIGIINLTDGWGVGYNGLRFGVVRLKDGLEHWTYQDDWSEDPMPALDPQKGSVYEIRYQWLGYGMQYFGVEKEDGNIHPAHRISYSGEFDDVSITNPNLPISAYVINDGNTDDVWIKTPSAIAGLEGDAYSDAISVNLAGSFEGDITAGEDVAVASFRMGSTYLGMSNRLFAQALRLTLATDGAKPVTFKIYSGGTVEGGTWEYLSEQVSPLEFNNTITGITGGLFVAAFAVGKVDNQNIDLELSKFRLYPGQTLTLAATGAQASDIVAAVNWLSFL